MGPINDIALIKLSEHLEFDEKIAPICLPKNHSEDDLVDEDKTLLVVAGWGTTENDTSSDKLLELFLEYKKSAVCESEFQSQVSSYWFSRLTYNIFSFDILHSVKVH